MIKHFRSQARVIDLLGREQIADSPTAMGELFKNALDAAASEVRVDYRPKAETCLVSDNGLGMRFSDVVDKWLVLATDSSHTKGEQNQDWMQFATPQQKEWLKLPRYGEKGIGRLSISLLGRMTLLWTVWGIGKAKRGTLCLVHWHLFRHPGKLFDDLPIPCIELDHCATQKDVNGLIKLLLNSASIKSLLTDETWHKSHRDELRSDLEKGITLSDKNDLLWENGTTFIIAGLNEFVPDLFEKRNEKRRADEDLGPEQLKSYHAFSTFWDPFHSNNEQRIFKINAFVNGKAMPETQRYWDPEDFTRCDHHIRIEVDQNGFAQGTLRNYGVPPIHYQKQLKQLPTGARSPGAFFIEIGYLQGVSEVSKVPEDDRREIEQRLHHAGGFSIYKNGVRVQPYGTVDNDFGRFEARRLKNAGRYYFAARRMFGGLFLNAEDNPDLREKAGREGFVMNGALRALRLWIEDLFIDLADSHYGTYADRQDKKIAKERRKTEEAKKKEEELKERFRIEFRKSGKNLTKTHNQIVKLGIELESFITSENNATPGAYIDYIQSGIDKLQTMLNNLHALPNSIPLRVVLERDERDEFDQYVITLTQYKHDLNKRIVKYSQLLEKAKSRVWSYKERISEIEDRKKAFLVSLETKIEGIISPVINKHGNIRSKLQKIKSKAIEELKQQYQLEVEDISNDAIVRDQTFESAKKLEVALQKVREYYEENIKPWLTALGEEMDQLLEGSASILLTQRMSDEIIRLKEREQYIIELAQLGLITETADHEYAHHVSLVKHGLSTLADQLKDNNLSILRTIETAFNIVDSRMRLFDPLIRRRGVISVELLGEDIIAFLKDHFSEAFESHAIEIHNSFNSYSAPTVKIPVFLGAIHNVVHNGLYWCKKTTEANSRVRLSSEGSALIISDTGPGISNRDAIRIFEPGFSRKPYGRGLGLYIAQGALDGIGYTLAFDPESRPNSLSGANFVIIQKGVDADE